MNKMARSKGIVVVGTSLGGLTALEQVLAALPIEFPVPIAVVQHRGKAGDDGMRRALQRSCRLPVLEAEDKMSAEAGRVYLAPPDYHLLVEDAAFELSTDPPVNAARPSVDVLFESAAEIYKDRAVAVVLTGLNTDGAHGAQKVKENGGIVIVQDPATAEAPSMPRAVLEATRVDHVVPISQIVSILLGLFLEAESTVPGHAP